MIYFIVDKIDNPYKYGDEIYNCDVPFASISEILNIYTERMCYLTEIKYVREITFDSSAVLTECSDIKNWFYTEDKITLLNIYELETVSTFRLLIDNYGLDVIQDPNPIEFVCAKRNIDLVRFLLNNGADGTHGLYQAIGNSDEQMVKLLIDAGADVTFSNNLGEPIYNGDIEIIKLLINAGIDINSPTYLSLALECKNIDVIKLLIENKIDVTVNKNQAIKFAFMTENMELIKILINAGADIGAIDDATIEFHMKKNNRDIIDLLINLGIKIENTIFNINQ